MATAASRTTNPLLLAMVIAVVVVVVSARRSGESWAGGLRAYLVFGLFVIGVRILFRMLLEGQHGAHVLFTLPELPLPEVAAGIRIGGPVSLEGVLAAFYDGLRLATLLICLGSANVLANPKRLLKSLPGALYEVGSAVTVALTVAPQLIDSALRIRAARRLRGGTARSSRLLEQVLIPVMTDALDRSLLLASAMDSRGYGRSGGSTAGARRLAAALVIGGLLGICVGTYGLLDGAAPRALGLPLLATGVLVACGGLAAGRGTNGRTRYRPDRWLVEEWAVAAVGVAVAAVLYVTSSLDPSLLHPSLQPLEWPALPLGTALAVLAGALPAVIAPVPPGSLPTGPQRGSGPVEAVAASPAFSPRAASALAPHETVTTRHVAATDTGGRP